MSTTGRERNERRALLALLGVGAVVVAAVAGVLVAGGGGDGDAPREVLLERAAAAGPNPFTPPVDPADPADAALVVGAQPVSGAKPAAGGALYGGSGDDRVCDTEALIAFLEQNPAQARAWAGVRGVPRELIGFYVRTQLTPTVLLYDTRVTNHGYANGRATPRQSVLQAGTAVLVDGLGQPVVKCKCGNPLGPPIPTVAKPAYKGTKWPGFTPEASVTVATTPPTEVTVPDSAPDVSTTSTAPAEPAATGRAFWEGDFNTTFFACAGQSRYERITPRFEAAATDEPGVWDVTVTFAADAGAPWQPGPWTFRTDQNPIPRTITPISDAAKDFARTCPLIENKDGKWWTRPLDRKREPATTVPTAPPEDAQSVLALDTVAGVQSGPTAPTTFTLDTETTIVWIRTYHWFGEGSLGTIALRGSDGKEYGPWAAAGRPGQGGRANAYWDVAPNVTLSPGTYEVVDSDPSTWSQNADTGGRGIAWIYGEPTGSDSTSPYDGSYTVTLPSVECSDPGTTTESAQVVFTVAGKKVTAVITTSAGVSEYRGRVRKNGKFRIQAPQARGNGTITVTGTFEDGQIRGKWVSLDDEGDTCVPEFSGSRA